MKLVVVSMKICWRCAESPSGFATDGGFPFQMRAIAQLFDQTRLVLPEVRSPGKAGEAALEGPGLSVVPLSSLASQDLARRLRTPVWLLRNLPVIWRELRAAGAVHTPVPGDVGMIAMVLALVLRKPLFVRHCANWLEPRTPADRALRWIMESFAGGRNVMFATGGTSSPPSARNPEVRWIFSSSLTGLELEDRARVRRLGPGPQRLAIVARQTAAKGAGLIIQALPLLRGRFPGIGLDIVGEGPALGEFRQLARQTGVEDQVCFTGKLNHDQVMDRLSQASLFVFPTRSSDGFPKAVLEGLASGLPVVASRVSVLPQLLASGCGVLLDEATPEGVARGVALALGSPAGYEAMSRQALQTASQFSIESWRDALGERLGAAWGPLKSGVLA